MTGTVNENSRPDLRAARVADTEQRILRSAEALFRKGGYAGTSLAAVATAAGVAPRTVYVRFGTKAALLKRLIDVALVGDTAPIDVAHRDWFQATFTAATLAERIDASAHAAREMMDRAGPLIAVALQAQATEPVIAAAAQAGREATRDSIRLFWRRAAEDRLLPPAADVDWIGETAALLYAAETYLLATRTAGWDPDAYERWLRTTMYRLAGTEPPARRKRRR